MKKVFLAGCDEYDRATLRKKIETGLADIGMAPDDFKNARVALKPNLLNASPVEKAVVTHPEFFRAVVDTVKSYGGAPVLVESPAFQSLEKVVSKTGYDAIIRDERIPVWNNRDTVVAHNPSARKYRRFEIAAPLADADIIINLPKFKTHEITYITAAVKNLFGVIPGLNKSQWHVRAKTKSEFSEFLLDLYGAIVSEFSASKKIVHIADAVIGMEGAGPGASGTPRRIGAIVAGVDAIAVDFVLAAIVGIDSAKVTTITSGAARGLGAASFDDIDICGGRISDFSIKGFQPPKTGIADVVKNWSLERDIMKNLLVERPFPVEGTCTLCYQCKKICPVGAIGMADAPRRVPLYDYSKCIRCYCCMEICPEAAIRLKRGKLQWLIDRA